MSDEIKPQDSPVDPNPKDPTGYPFPPGPTPVPALSARVLARLDASWPLFRTLNPTEWAYVREAIEAEHEAGNSMTRQWTWDGSAWTEWLMAERKAEGK